jgi:hypothetical protein
MRLKDLVEVIKSDVVDLTDGPFDVDTESDDGGTHIVISLEFHEDARDIMRRMIDEHGEKRILVKLVPEGYIHSGINKSD